MLKQKPAEQTKPKLLPDTRLTQKASLNAVAALLDYGVRLLVGFVVGPLLVSGLGDFFYGVWQVLGRLVGYVSAAGGRPTQAIKWTTAHQKSSSDLERKRRDIGSAIVVWFVFAPILLLIGGIMTWYAPQWLNAEPEQFLVIRLTSILLVLNMTLIGLTGLPQAVLQGENLGYKRMGLSAFVILLGGGMTALTLFLGYGLVGVAIAYIASTILGGVFFFSIMRSYVPWFGVSRPRRQEVKQFLGLSGWFMSWRLINKLIMSSDVVVLGFLGSAEGVTVYTLTKYLPETIISLVAVVVGGIVPGLGDVIGQKDLEKAVRIRKEIVILTWLFATIIGTVVILWDRSFVTLWVGDERYAGSLPLLMIMIMVVQLAFIRNDAHIIDLTLNLRSKVAVGLVSSLVSILIASAFLHWTNLGVVGLCLGFIIGRFILSISYPYLISQLLEQEFAAGLHEFLRPVLVTAVLFLLSSRLNQSLPLNSWFSLASYAILSTLIIGLLAFTIGLTSTQKHLILNRFSLAIKLLQK